MWEAYCSLTQEAFRAIRNLNRIWIIGWVLSACVFFKWLLATGFALGLGFTYLLIKGLVFCAKMLIDLVLWAVDRILIRC